MTGSHEVSGSIPLISTKAEPDEPQRFAWLLPCSGGLHGQRRLRAGLPARAEDMKKGDYRTRICVR